MTIEVGKTYRARCGVKVQIIKIINNDIFPMLGVIDYGSYEEPGLFSKSGKFLSSDESALDLIEELK